MRVGSAVALVVVVLFAACGSSDGEEATSSWFFNQLAAGGSLDADELVLDDVSASLLAGTDRPEREVARLSTQSFADTWEQRFDGDPPNAVLSARAGGEEVSVDLVVDAPAYDADTGSMRYSVTPLSAVPAGLGRFGAASLVIDAAPPLPFELRIGVREGGQTTWKIAAQLDQLRGTEAVILTDVERRLELRLFEPGGPDFAVVNDSGRAVIVEISQDDEVLLDEPLESERTLEFRPPS